MRIHLKTLHFSLSLLLVGISLQSVAATLSIGGNYRFGSNLFSNLDLSAGTPQGGGNTSTFIETRALLAPDVVIDDRFQVKSEIILFGYDSTRALNNVPPSFGSALGNGTSTDNGGILLSRAWLEWASDWGIFRAGRQPKHWGMGILHNSGKDVLDDFQTTVDRVGFQALLGNLGVNLGYEKENEGLLNRDSDDGDTFELSLDYSNPESMLDVGILYARNVRSVNSGLGKSSHDLSIFSQKKWKNLQFGGEFVLKAQDGNGSTNGILGQIDYKSSAFTFGADFAWATAENPGDFNFHPNYQPLMILYRQSLGPTQPLANVRGASTGSAFGSAIANGTGAGAFLMKGRMLYAFDQDRYHLGTDIGWAKLTHQGTNAGSGLGVELDVHLAQKWYENFTTHYGLGILFPGEAFGTGAQTAWGLQVRGALRF